MPSNDDLTVARSRCASLVGQMSRSRFCIGRTAAATTALCGKRARLPAVSAAASATSASVIPAAPASAYCGLARCTALAAIAKRTGVPLCAETVMIETVTAVAPAAAVTLMTAFPAFTPLDATVTAALICSICARSAVYSAASATLSCVIATGLAASATCYHNSIFKSVASLTDIRCPTTATTTTAGVATAAANAGSATVVPAALRTTFAPNKDTKSLSWRDRNHRFHKTPESTRAAAKRK